MSSLSALPNVGKVLERNLIQTGCDGEQVGPRMPIRELPDGEIVDLPCALFADAKEGDIISITVDADETAKRRERIAQLQESIWAD